MITKSILGSLNTRVFEMDGNIYTSFTPSMAGDNNKYQVYDALTCDVEVYNLYAMNSSPANTNLRDYVLNTLGQLRYNNPHTESFGELIDIFRYWVLQWRGNEEIDWYKVEPFVYKYEQTLMEDPLSHVTRLRTKSHWYPLATELIVDHTERRKQKSKLRSNSYREGIKEEIQVESNHFRNSFWNITPTAKYLSEVVDSSLSTVKRYGKGHYAPQKEVTGAFITQFKKMHPELTQKELLEKINSAYGINVSLRTLKTYWSDTNLPPAETTRPGN